MSDSMSSLWAESPRAQELRDAQLDAWNHAEPLDVPSRDEYEEAPPRCDNCDEFGHITVECPHA